jgi:hypothetical protein
MPDDDDDNTQSHDWRRARTVPERLSTLEEQVSQLRQMQVEAGNWRGEADRKLDLLISKADEAKGRSDTIKMLITGLPSTVWTLTLGGMVAFVVWLWHQGTGPGSGH